MSKMDYLKELPIAVIGAGAVGKTIAADCKLAGQNVRLYDAMPFAEKSLLNVERTGIEIDGTQRNLYNFKRSGIAKLDMVTTNMEMAIKGAGIIVIAMPAIAHENTFKNLMPYLENGQVIHIFTDNFGSLLFRKIMRELKCDKKIIIGGWSSAPYGTRIETIGGFTFPHCSMKYRAIGLRGATLPMTDIDDFMETTVMLGCLDAVTTGNGPVKGKTVLDIGFSNINPVIHVPATLLGVSTMENWGKIFGDFDKTGYSMYAHALCPSICEVQYKFYQEEIALAEEIGVDLDRYEKSDFFTRRSVLTLEYMGKGNMYLPLDEPTTESNVGPNNIHHRYVTEDVPVGCKIYHDLGVKYGVKTPIIDSMITIASAMIGKDYFTEGYTLEYLGIGGMSKEELIAYLNEGVYNI
ncbi:MAG: opine dehydrogenase [Clostridium sp.]|jgi:opine dehydrogenase